MPWVVGEGPNGEGVDGEGPNDEEVEGESPNDEGVVGEGPNGERLNPVACGGTPPIPFWRKGLIAVIWGIIGVAVG